MSHPNVCRVYDIAEYEGQSFLTMEFVDGEDLSSVLKRMGRMTEEKGVEIARQLCSALAAVPVTTRASSRTTGQPSVYWVNITPPCAAESQGRNSSGCPPSGAVRWPWRRTSICHRYTGSSRFHEKAGNTCSCAQIATRAATRARRAAGQWDRNGGAAVPGWPSGMAREPNRRV